MKYVRNYLVHYYEIDKKRRITIPTIFHYLEDMAIRNSEEIGLTLDYYEENNQGWMLIQWDIEILRYPMFNEEVTITTTPSAFISFMANREYEITDKEGNLLISAKSVWLLADMNTRRPIRIPDTMYNTFGIGKESADHYYKLDELKAMDNGSYCSDVKIKNTDLDSNDHVNNVKYVEWALASLPPHCVDNYAACRIKANYRKELNLHDEAKVISNIAENGVTLVSSHSLFNNANICNIEITWQKEN